MSKQILKQPLITSNYFQASQSVVIGNPGGDYTSANGIVFSDGTIQTTAGTPTTLTGSFVTTSSFNAFTSSYNTGSFTGSFTGSLLGTSSWARNALTTSFTDRAATLDLYGLTLASNSYILFSNVVAATGQTVGGNNNLRYNSSTNVLTVGNISATTLTGSLLGTSSWATNALTASFAPNYVLTSQTSSMSVATASYADTLDGLNSSQFARLDIANTFDGVNTTTQKTLRTDNTYTIAETLYASSTITGPDTQSIELFNIYDYITYSADRPIANTAAIFNYTILDPNTVAIRSGQINLSWSPGTTGQEAITETQTIVNSGESSNITFDSIVDYSGGTEYVKLRVLNGSSADIYVRGFLRII